MMFRAAIGLGAIALLGACEMKVGKDEEPAAKGEQQAARDQPAAGKAEEGRFSVKVPGFDMKVNLPQGVAETEGGNDLFYPGAAISGLHIEAAKPSSGVELRFTSADAPAKVAAWYRDPARANGFRISSAKQDGEAVLITGTQKSDGDPFSVRLSPGSGGGTEGRLTLSDRQ
jgi:hypothetical protein